MQLGDGSAAMGGAALLWTLSSLGSIRWLLFVIILLSFGLRPMMTSLDDAERNYSEVSTADWAHTNYWLKSADCARETGHGSRCAKTTVS
jgi:hypothetical protein